MPELRNLSRLIGMRGTKANIEAFSGTLEEQAFAYAPDTGQVGIYTNGAWAWFNLFSDAEGDPVDVSTGTASDGTSSYAARRDHVHRIDAASLSAGQVQGVVRWVSAGGTMFELPDLAEYLLHVFDNGSLVDP